MDSKLFSENLRYCRIKLGLRQEDMADKLCVERQTYCNYENGTRIPAIDIIAEIAEIFQVTIDELVKTKIS